MNERLEKAREIVKKHLWLATTAGVIPIPFLDLSFITGIQIKLIYQLSIHYDIPFSKEAVKTIILTLCSGVLTGTTARLVGGSLTKSIPFVGQMTAPIVTPTLAGASTYALGTIFIHHFESGGTILNLDPEKTRQYYESEFEKQMRQE